MSGGRGRDDFDFCSKEGFLYGDREHRRTISTDGQMPPKKSQIFRSGVLL